MRFLVDMPLSPVLARWLEQEGHDAVHASRIDLSRASDEEVLDKARIEDRVVVTRTWTIPGFSLWLAPAAPRLSSFAAEITVKVRLRS